MKANFYIVCIWIFLGMIFFPPPGISMDEEWLDSCIYHLKRYRTEALKSQARLLDHEYLKTLLQAEVDYLESGIISQSVSAYMDQPDERLGAVTRLLYANHLRRSATASDFTVYRLFFDAFNAAERLSDTVLVNLILPEINHFYFRNGVELDKFDHYLRLSNRYARDSIDRFWYSYYAIGREMQAMDMHGQKADTTRINSLFVEMENYAPSDFFRAYACQQKAIYYDVFRAQKEKALELYLRAKENYQKIPHFYSQKGIPSIRFNEAILHYETGQYRKALSYFIRHQESETESVYQMYGYEWIYKCYEALDQTDSAYYYFKQMTVLKDSIDRTGTALDVNKIEFGYNLNKKERQLRAALTATSRQKNRSRAFLIGAVLLAGFNVLAYFLIRKFKTKSSQLEEEKSETIVRLEELKNIVTKDFIMLQDKTKVYVSDLVYIKSDDHYLHIFLKNEKNYFVRGTLKKMNRELPPNFKRCHRSYIVNENYISRIDRSVVIMTNGSAIPMSKSYRESF